MATRSVLNRTSVIGFVLALFGVAAMVAGFDIAPDPDGGLGARVFPLIAAVALLILGGLECWNGFRSARTLVTADRAAWGSILLLLVLCIGYVWLIGKLGYLISTALAAPLAMLLFGIRHPLGLLLAAILCPLIYHAIFFMGLGVFPPYGEWFDLLDLFAGE